MIEIIPSVWVSPNAKIGNNVLFGKNVTIYGNTTIGENTVIEGNVAIGHPSPFEVEYLLSKPNYNKWNKCLHKAYDSITKEKTHIGKNSIIRSNTVIYSGNEIDDFFDCGHNVIIREGCKIGKYCYFFTNAQIKREAIIGQGCRIADFVGDRTKIGAYSSMLGQTVHKYNDGVGGKIEEAPIIGIGVVVGFQSVIVGGISINNFSIVAANSIVLDDVDSFVVVAGIPAKLKRNRNKNEISDILERMKNDNFKLKTLQ